MTKYKIKYNYDTGDSFNQYPNQEEVLELEWTNLDVAKANLNRIEKHYEMYRALNSYSSYRKSREEIIKQYENEDWFTADKHNLDYCITLYTDEGKPWQIFAPWCGYFEKLNYCEIVQDESDMKFYVR